MRRSFFMAFLLIAVGAFFVGCATAPQPLAPFQAYDLNPKVKSGDYTQSVDNFIVVFDGSTSMSDKCQGHKKLDLAREVVNRMNQTIPAIKLNGALRTFGQGSCIPGDPTSVIYGPAPYVSADMAKAIAKITCTGGNTPLGQAMEASAAELKAMQGPTAMIIFSDGEATDKAVPAAGALKKEFPGLCIYTVQIGDSKTGKAVLDEVAKAGNCGFATNAKDIMGGAEMAAFVEKVFLTKAAAKPKAVGKLDSDGDGVPDDIDQCPGTPKGAKVDERGCWVIPNVLFDFDKDTVKPQYQGVLDDVVRVLKLNPNVMIQLDGHTDSIGTDQYNMGLSQRRANSVKKYLEKAGIVSGRLTTKAYGESKPIAPNKIDGKDNPAGRAKNRRVELSPVF